MPVVADDRDIIEQYLAWKRLVPYLYDSFINHHLTWPSLSCCWGPVVQETPTKQKQQLYLSEQTDGTEPNKLVLVTAEIIKPRTATSEAVSSWSEQASSPQISQPLKTLVHPGEVNKLLNIPKDPSVLVTHSDTSDVYVWHFNYQEDRAADISFGRTTARRPSVPNIVLKGHTANAEFALGVSEASPSVTSGGKDMQVLVWNLYDSQTGLSGKRNASVSEELLPRTYLTGHNRTVEDVCFKPESDCELASVADDYMLLLWDTRTGKVVDRVSRAHGERDLHCVDWSALRPMQLATGAQDGGVRIWDRRNLGGPLYVLNHHSNAVMNVEWSRHRGGLLATGADDGLVCVWDLDAPAPDNDGIPSKRTKAPAPYQLLFQHAGHRSPVVDFCWNPVDPWTIMSTSVDTQSSGGGTLQIWRISDMIWRPEEEVMAELEPYKDYIVTGDESKLPSIQQQKEVAHTDKEGDAAFDAVGPSNAART